MSDSKIQANRHYYCNQLKALQVLISNHKFISKDRKQFYKLMYDFYHQKISETTC